jgi:Nucleotidyl transferase AbiEii toxin, Type IV TA system
VSIEDAKNWDFPPPNARSLGRRIRNLAEQVDVDPDLMEVAFAQVVLGQMLPGVLRGGAALKIRIGPLGSRFSSDADLVLPHALVPDSFEGWINNGKKQWGQFRVSISRRKRDAQPEGVPPDYVIRTYTARIFYGDSEWRAVKLEVGRDEVGGFQQPAQKIAEEWAAYFGKIGLDDPGAVALFPYPEQIVQKLDGCTRPDKKGDNDRAHDLVDIQLILLDTHIAPSSLYDLARSTFAYRNVSWPPTARQFPSWATLYAADAVDYPEVVQDLDEAVRWLQRLIDEIG